MNPNLLTSIIEPIDEWQPLVPLDTPNLPRLNHNNLPSWVGNYAKALSIATETPFELAAGMLLVTCATAVARRLKIMIKPGYFEPCNLWVITALPPGNRKSAVQSAATSPLLTWEYEQATIMGPEIKRVASELKTLESRAKEFRRKAATEKLTDNANKFAKEAADIEASFPEVPRVPQLWTSDATPERLGSLLVEHDECMAWLSSEGGIFDLLQGRYSHGIPNLDLILKSHSGDSERVDRGSRPPVFLNSPRLSIGLSPQPDVLRGLANKPGFRGRGLLARFLYLLPISPLGYRTLKSTPIPEEVSNAYFAGITAMLNWQPVSPTEDIHVLQVSESAYAEWYDFALNIETQMRPGGNMEHFTDWSGKAAGAAARIAGILHGVKHAHGKPWETVVTTETMSDALEIMAVIMQHSCAALNMMGADPIISAAKAVWHWLERNRCQSCTIREVFNALRSIFAHVKDLRNALNVLQERSYIEIIESQTGSPGRPASPLIRVRPEIIKSWQ